jgi:hypothetical protein
MLLRAKRAAEGEEEEEEKELEGHAARGDEGHVAPDYPPAKDRSPLPPQKITHSSMSVCERSERKGEGERSERKEWVSA